MPAQPAATGRGGDWWGVGPGAHSHVGGVRWWNVKHPAAYAVRVADGPQPGRTAARCSTPRRAASSGCCSRRGCVEGLPVDVLDDGGSGWLPDLRREGLVTVDADRVVLTTRGRLLADAVVRDLVP